MDAVKKRKCILVLGMHRSGTSLISGLLNIVGVYFGKNLLPPAFDNEKGFFENVDILNENIDFLRVLGVDSDALDPLPFNWRLTEAHKTFKKNLEKIIRETYLGHEIFCIKDPRISVFLETYIEILEKLGIEIKYIISKRDPLEVAMSLKKRNKISYGRALDAYYRYYENIGKFIDEKNIIEVDMSKIIENPHVIIEDINTKFRLFSHTTLEFKNKIESFVSPSLKHHGMSDTHIINTNLKTILESYDQVDESLNFNIKKVEALEERILYDQRLIEDQKQTIEGLSIKIFDIERSIIWKSLKMFDKVLYLIIPQDSLLGRLYLKFLHSIQDIFNSWVPILGLKFLANNNKEKKGAEVFWQKHSEEILNPDVLFINHQESRTGAPKILYEIAKAVSVDKKVVIVSLQKGGMTGEFQEFFGPIVYPEDMYFRENGQEIAYEIVKKIKPKLIYANSIGTFQYAIAGRRLGIPVIFHVHELELAFKVVFTKKERENFKDYADHFIVVSEPVKNLLKELDCAPEKVTLIEEFIDSKKVFEKSKEFDPVFIKNEMGVEEGDVVVVALGEFIYRKGNDIFMKVAKKINSRYPHCKFVWVGKRSSHGRYSLDFSLNINEYSKYFTHISEKSNPFPYLKMADVLALPSREDPFPLVVLEAMSLGIPSVIFKEAGGIANALKDGGIIVSKMSEESFEKGILELVEDKRKREVCGEKSRENQKPYELASVLPKILGLIDKNLKK